MDGIAVGLQELLVQFLTFLPKMAAALAIFIVSLYGASVLAKFIQKTMHQRDAGSEVILLVVKLSRWTVIILGTFAALQQVGFNVSAFLAGLGILGFTVGFALQDVSKNIVAGLLLLLEQPFNIGDIIEVDGYLGRVLQVDLRTTDLFTYDGQNVLIPNGDVFSNPITNYSRYPNRRLDLTVGIAYGSDLEFVRQTALAAAQNVDGVIDSPPPRVIFNNFGDSSIEFTLYFWIDFSEPSDLKHLDATNSVVMEINNAFVENNIVIPFPIRTVVMKK